MSAFWEIRLSGSGGQGLVLSSIIFGEAATAQGYHVAQSQSYGPEARGGTSRAEVIISSSMIDYPLVQEADILLALTEEAYNKYCYAVKEKGIVILDASIEGKLYRSRVYSLPILETAREYLQSPISANMICLGVLSVMDIPVKPELISQSLQSRVPPQTKDINLKAFQLGQSMLK